MTSRADLWRSAIPRPERFQPADSDRFEQLPAAARADLGWALAPNTPLATAVRLRLRGEIRLEPRWQPFRAAQVIHWPRGTIWQATVWANGLPIRGSDRLIDGTGAMQWRLLGLFPVMTATGPDISRSTWGRLLAELVWLPSALALPTVTWTAVSERAAIAHLPAGDETSDLHLSVTPDGQLERVSLQRWGDPDGGAFQYQNFGALVAATGQFGGYRIPTRLRVGWYLGSDRFDREGEFFRVTVTAADYR